MYWFTSDEHYGHTAILQHCNRPFTSIEEMNETIIRNFNEAVKSGDVTIHAGDFCWYNKSGALDILKKLNGTHINLRGSHDHWLAASAHEIWSRNLPINGVKKFIVVCHYPMLRWERSHYDSYQLYGHTHGRCPLGKNQHDIGVDNNNFYPVSLEQIVQIMESKNERNIT